MAQTMTKRNYFEMIIDMANAANLPDLASFAIHEIELIDNRNAKAKERKAAKAKEPDAFAEAIQGALTNEFQTAGDIVAALGIEELTAAKAIYRLNAFVEAGIAVKDDIKVDKSTRKGYRLA